MNTPRKRGRTGGDLVRDEIEVFVRDYWLRYHNPPSFRQIMDSIGVFSTATIAYHVRIMKQEGRLENNERIIPTGMTVSFDQ